MTDLTARMRAAWAILRGRPVVRGVAIEHGEVTIRGNGSLLVSHADILHCQIWTQGPVILRADATSHVSGNEGNALVTATPEHRQETP